jgi:hypothetical protein
MSLADFKKAVAETDEVELTVTDRFRTMGHPRPPS